MAKPNTRCPLGRMSSSPDPPFPSSIAPGSCFQGCSEETRNRHCLRRMGSSRRAISPRRVSASLARVVAKGPARSRSIRCASGICVAADEAAAMTAIRQIHFIRSPRAGSFVVGRTITHGDDNRCRASRRAKMASRVHGGRPSLLCPGIAQMDSVDSRVWLPIDHLRFRAALTSRSRAVVRLSRSVPVQPRTATDRIRRRVRMPPARRPVTAPHAPSA